MLQTRDLEMIAGRTTVSEASRTYFGVNSALGRCEQTYRMKNQLVTPPVMLCRMSRCKSRALPATFSLSIKPSNCALARVRRVACGVGDETLWLFLFIDYTSLDTALS